MLAPVLVTPPSETPVSLAEAKAHCRVDHDDDDTLIESLIAAASGHLDGWSGILGRALVTQTWRRDFGSFADKLRLPLAPAASIGSITYYDGDNAQQTLSTDVYRLFTDARGPYVALKPDQSWPGTYGRDDAVSVTFAAGYGAAAAVPAPLKSAILLLVGAWYENREQTVIGVSVSELPQSVAVNALIAPYRRISL